MFRNPGHYEWVRPVLTERLPQLAAPAGRWITKTFYSGCRCKAAQPSGWLRTKDADQKGSGTYGAAGELFAAAEAQLRY